MQKGQQTEGKTCIKLGPGRLGVQMEAHQHPPPPVCLLYTVATRGGEVFLREGGVTPRSSGTGETCDSFSPKETCDSFSPNVNIKGKNSCAASFPLLQLRLCQSKHAIFLGVTMLALF
jgi:hypothetical protein